MLIYYDRYGRRNGFCFFGNNWPQGITVDNTDLQGTGYLWNIFTNLYGDLGGNLNAPKSSFVLRDCFGALHATVYGVAGVGKDGGRSVTYVDFAVRIPQSREEAEADFDPQDLLRELQTPHVPGTCVQAPPPAPRKARSVSQTAVVMGRALAWRPLTMLCLGDAMPRQLPALAQQIYAVLPAARRRKFSFVSYCANWSVLCQIGGIDLIGTDLTRESLETVAMMQHSGADLACLQQGAGALQMPPHKADAATRYLQRIYPRLLQDGMLEQPDQSARWLQSSPLAPICGKVPKVYAQALGFILRAAAGGDSLYYPLTTEKEELCAAVLAASGRSKSA